MPNEFRLWKVAHDVPVVLSQRKLDLESRLEQWLLRDISMVSRSLLVIGHQVPTAHSGPIDVLAIDPAGNLVILELKKDKTPRNVVAQALDYASWVQELDHEQVEKIASEYLSPLSLEEAFRQKFSEDLPEVLNERHRLYIVAASLDAATERIISYLSETHGVDINGATFAYFKDSEGEFLARSLLLDESEVETRAVKKSKRRPNRTWEEFSELARKAGVLPVYEATLKSLSPLFEGKRRTRSNVSFIGLLGTDTGDDNDKNMHAMIGIYPGESSKSQGLAMTVDLESCSAYFAMSVEELQAALGDKSEAANTYWPDSTFFFDTKRLNQLVGLLTRAKARSRG